ncbi:hypothetical protein ASD64_05685 [Mesorhizobium sp. Root157]|uniref:SGNH/GDSL hydrolase family protein n=1 Tax=Mesorhizobium sp. Root157 TaxID=1736477 RepID=UPI000702246B|nr:DUF459 domain-containing protein [Mesorhizobium sp. Root157]KQZ86955.1 hypothetical protein ASD64_05685 [Mesorhizobium sp. Root157]
MVSALRIRATLFRTPILILAFAALLAVFAGALHSPAMAQEPQYRSWSLRDLFRPRKSERIAPPEAIPMQPPKARTQTRKSIQRSAPAEPPPKPVVEKLPDARAILVVGDFMAGSLANDLEAVFAENAAVRVVDRSKGSSGFVRDDFYNWPAEIGALLEAEKPAAVVVMLGSNDRQQLQIGDVREPPLSEAWTKEYEKRTVAFGKQISSTKVPFLWVGMPAFRSAKMTSDMLAFNEIYRASAEQIGGEFVDIWDGFVDENGAFITRGPDINGQPVTLRADDGINLTRAGKRKVAFYTEKPLLKILGLTSPTATISSLTPMGLSAGTPADTIAPINIDRTPPMLLNDPALDGGIDLLGTGAALTKPISVGTTAGADHQQTASPGRADDFSWPQKKLPDAAQGVSDKTTAIIR